MGRKVAAIYDIADHYTMPADQDCDHFVSHLILSANKKLGNVLQEKIIIELQKMQCRILAR